MSRPLEGIRVLDLSRVLAGPYCTMCLADLGADVIKVERPGRGDDTRQWGPPFVGGESAYFLCCNRNKRSLTLDLKCDQGRCVARQLIAASDVLVENFRPGTMERLGLGYDELVRQNDRLVYCSITGFGQSGPRSDEPGYDILIQGISGLMSITGEPDGVPMKVGVAVTDINAGLTATSAILAALFLRERTGGGERIDISLMDCAVASLANIAASFLLTGENPPRHGNAHPNIVPYQAFATADQPVIVAVGNDRQWLALCQALDCPELAADARFASNASRVQHRSEITTRLQEVLARLPAAECLQRLRRAGVPGGPVHDLEGVFREPQIRARDMVLNVDHPAAGVISLVNTAFRFGSTNVQDRSVPPPSLGQHNVAILQQLGYSAAEIAGLRDDGVI